MTMSPTSQTVSPVHIHIERRPHRHRPEWRRAFRAVYRLVREPAKTHLAFEVSLALDGSTAVGILDRMLVQREGRTLLRERPCLADALCDRSTLEALPEDSLGRAYLRHLDTYELDPRKLLELGEAFEPELPNSDPDVRWAGERGRLAHDLWHVLAGYGADQAGESTLLAFSWAQNGSRANALLTIGSSLKLMRAVGPAWIPYIWTAWTRGRRAVCLAAVPWERLLALPLDEVRAQAGIEPPDAAHPGGVLRDSEVFPEQAVETG